MSSDLILLRSHSPLGASAAERYINCPGSVRLAESLRTGFPSVEPDYTRHGVTAHKIVAYCLSNQIGGVWEILDREWGCEFSLPEISSMQGFLDLVRNRVSVFKHAYGGQSVTTFIEFPLHCPELHELFYGTFDVGIVAGEEAEIIDYKHGAGVAVDVEKNPQLQMYAVGFVLHMPEIRRVRLRISQPRAYHPDGPDRSWEIEVPELMQWLDNVLLPAMEDADPRQYEGWDDVDLPPLKPGEWCRFCPAKRQCPALEKQLRIIGEGEMSPLDQYSTQLLGELYAMIPTVKMRMTSIEDEVHRRNLADPTNLVPGTKIVARRGYREWKEGAEVEISNVYGLGAYEPAKLLSPNKLEEKYGEAAVKLTKVHAFTPDNGYTTAPEGDRRKAVSLQKPGEKYQLFLEGEVK